MPATAPLRIGTRSSRLALWQAEHVKARVEGLGRAAELCLIETAGDLDRTSDFGSMGAKGIFVKEIETALLEGRIDLAVHSLKDLPTDLPPGLALGAALERASPFDALVSRGNVKFADLPKGATIATGSLRRAAQALALRPDLKIAPLRGNVPTRVRKIREAAAEATFLAVAGLGRLGLEGEISEIFSAEQMTPSMGQGAVAIEARAGEHAELLAALEHAATRAAVDAERAFIARIGGGCKTPVGVLAEPVSETTSWRILGMLASADGRSLVRDSRAAGSPEGLLAAAGELADSILSRADDAMRASLPPR